MLQSVKQNFYVDDCLKSAAIEGEAIQMVKDLAALCQNGVFILEKWINNSRVVLQTITEDRRAKDLKELDLDRDKLPVERALGLQWCVETDAFRFKMELKQHVSHQTWHVVNYQLRLRSSGVPCTSLFACQDDAARALQKRLWLG